MWSYYLGWKRHEEIHIAKGHEINPHLGNMIHFCKFCNKDFQGWDALKSHERIHVETSATTENPEQSGREEPLNLKVDKNSIKIEKSLESPDSKLEYHKRTHTSSKTSSCRYCTLKFSGNYSAKKHERFHIKKNIIYGKMEAYA